VLFRSDLSPYEFDVYVKDVTRKDHPGPNLRGIDGAIAEILFDDYVIPDLRKLGVKNDDILSQGTLD